MSRYLVQYAAANGKIRSEAVDADSERSALYRIETKGLTPISVSAAPAAGTATKEASASRQLHGRRHVRSGKAVRKALLDFTHQLAAVAESGIPIIAGLRAVAEQTAHPGLRSAIGRIADRIDGGRALADAIDAEPEIFPILYVRTVAAGEAAGKIPDVLNALARYQEQEEETRGAIKSALLYPSLVVVTLVLAISFMLIFVVPQFALLFQKFQGKLPLPTQILIGASAAVTQHYLVVLSVGAVLIIGLRRFFRYRRARSWLDFKLLKLPVFGELLLGVYMVRFVELLDLLMQAALPIVQSLRVTADSMTNLALEKDVRGMIHSVEGGRSLTEAFAETRWLTPLVKRMLAIGEQSGRTDQIFAYLKKYYANQTRRGVKVLSTLVEPVMVVSLAVVVLFFALAIFLPMWKLLKIVGTA